MSCRKIATIPINCGQRITSLCAQIITGTSTDRAQFEDEPMMLDVGMNPSVTDGILHSPHLHYEFHNESHSSSVQEQAILWIGYLGFYPGTDYRVYFTASRTTIQQRTSYVRNNVRHKRVWIRILTASLRTICYGSVHLDQRIIAGNLRVVIYSTVITILASPKRAISIPKSSTL